MFLFQILERIFTGLFRECFCSRSLNEYLLDYLQDVSVLDRERIFTGLFTEYFCFRSGKLAGSCSCAKDFPTTRYRSKLSRRYKKALLKDSIHKKVKHLCPGKAAWLWMTGNLLNIFLYANLFLHQSWTACNLRTHAASKLSCVCPKLRI